MASFLESGALLLSREEAVRYRAAATRLLESSQLTIDLEMPITIEHWLLLRLADAALAGDFSDLDGIIEQIREEIRHRKKRH